MNSCSKVASKWTRASRASRWRARRRTWRGQKSQGAPSAVLISPRKKYSGGPSPKGTSTLYPYTAVDSHGVGYLLFSVSGPRNFPSPAYIRYGPSGPTGPVILATSGSAPEDGFTWTAHLSSTLFASDEAREGMSAFLEKRTPSWVRRLPDAD